MISFPPVDYADEDGIVAVGGDLSIETLKIAYRSGIFPWPVEDCPLLWFAPHKRAILEFKDFKIPKRLERDLKKSKFTFRINTNFKGVITECAKSPNRKGQNGTWILPEMVEAYICAHKAGLAISFEAYNENNKLVGGMYGIFIDRMFAGESMFYLETHASKFVLIETVKELKERGLKWMDIQVLTPLLQSFGAKEIIRNQFMKMLQTVISQPSFSSRKVLHQSIR